LQTASAATKEIASQDDHVFGVTSDLEAVGDTIAFGLSDKVFLAVVAYTNTSSTGADLTTQQSSFFAFQNVIVVGNI